MEFGNEKGTPKRPNAKVQLNPIASYFVLFSVPEEIAIYVTGRIFSNFSKLKIFFCRMEFGNEKGMPKKCYMRDFS